MRRIEALGLSIVFLLVIYRFFIGMEIHVVLRILATLLAIFYMWFGIYIFNNLGILDVLDKERRKILSNFRIISSVTAGFIYSFSLITVLSTLGFYATMGLMIVLALLINLIALVAGIYFYYKWKSDQQYISQFFLRSAFFLILFLVLFIIPVETRLNLLYKNHPGFIEAYKNYTINPKDPEAIERLKDERVAFRP